MSHAELTTLKLMERSIRLDLEAITKTAEMLSERIDARFPDRGITQLSRDLVALGSDTRENLETLSRPRWILRLIAAIVVITGVTLVIAVAVGYDTNVNVGGVDDSLSLLESAMQDSIFVGLACIFIFGIERRVKRREALKGLSELRSFAHVVDMHQLSKSPEAAQNVKDRTAHSAEHLDNPTALVHYLDYCSEMLSILNKMAAMYAQEHDDSVVLSAVTGIQDLTTAISSKLWQKITIVGQLDLRSYMQHPPN